MKLGAVMFQAVEVSVVVVVATKRFSSLIAAHDDVVKEPWCEDSGTAGQVSRIARCGKIVVIVMSDPIASRLVPICSVSRDWRK